MHSYLWLSSIVYMYDVFFILSSVDGHLGCFYVLAFVNSTAMNIRVHVSFSILFSSCYMLSSGITGSYGGFIPSFLRNIHTIFHSGCINLHSLLAMQEGSLFSTPSPAFIVCRLFDDHHSDWCEVISHYDLDLLSQIMSNVECLFI